MPKMLMWIGLGLKWLSRAVIVGYAVYKALGGQGEIPLPTN